MREMQIYAKISKYQIPNDRLFMEYKRSMIQLGLEARNVKKIENTLQSNENVPVQIFFLTFDTFFFFVVLYIPIVGST